MANLYIFTFKSNASRHCPSTFKHYDTHLLAVSGEGEVGRRIVRESISVLQGSAVFHSSEEGSALTNINFVFHHRGDSLHLSSSHCHQVVSIIV